MSIRLPGFVLCLLVLLPLTVAATSFTAEDEHALPTEALPVYNIAIVTDGTTARDLRMITLFKKEIQTLAEEEFVARFPKSLTLSGEDTVEGINRALDTLFANPQTDIILTLGAISSNEVIKRPNLPKPVVVPFLIDATTQNLPRTDGTSGTTNLTYIDPLFNIDQELITLQKIVPFNNIAILVDERDAVAIPDLSRITRQLASEHTITVNLVRAKSSASDTLAAIPAGTEAILVGTLYHMSETESARLVEGLIGRQLPSYSLWNREQVSNGLLASDIPKDMEENLARRSAVSVQDILLGEEAATLDVAFARGHDLTINMATARALNIYPSLAIMTGATLLNEQRVDIERRLTLQQAVNEAVTANLDLSAAELRVTAGTYAITEARSPLLPQINLGTGIRAIDGDRAELGMGSAPERAWTGTASLSQQIYSDRSWAGYTVEEHKQTGRVMSRDTVRLNITHSASVAYFNVLRTKTIEQLQKDNLKLTQANLNRAQIRMSTGVAGPDEVYRWETKFATDRITVLESESTTLDAMVALNRILNRPLQELFIAEETDLSDPLLIVGDELFFQLMHNPKYFHQFRSFAIDEALAVRPELKAIDAAIDAKRRIKTAAGRAYWLPEVSIEGQVEEYFAEDGLGQRGDFQDGLDDTDWQIGVFARIPLFEGGRRSGALNRTREELAQLQVQKRAAAERIGQEMLAILNRTRASYPGISLSREAADSAGRNLRLITDSYVQGIKSIIELLDAQNQALTADQAAANAVYNFLIDLMGVQRVMGEFTLFQPEEQRDEWVQRVQQYLQK